MVLGLRANFIQLFQFYFSFSVTFHFAYFLRQSVSLFLSKFCGGNHISERNERIYMIFSTELFLQVATESWPEWHLNPQPMNSIQTF